MEPYKPRASDQERRVVPLSLPIVLYQRVQAAAARVGVPVAEWMRQALTDKLEDA